MWKTFNFESAVVLFFRTRGCGEVQERTEEKSLEMLKNLTEAVLYLGTLELVFRRYKNSSISITK